MTIQNAPPGLDYDRDKKFSKVLVFRWFFSPHDWSYPINYSVILLCKILLYMDEKFIPTRKCCFCVNIFPLYAFLSLGLC